MKNHPLAIIILAAGNSSRMKTKTSKLLLKLGGKPMIHYPVTESLKLKPKQLVLVIGHQGTVIQNSLKNIKNVSYVTQIERLGTAHACRTALPLLSDFKGTVLVMPGDIPLIKTKLLNELVEHHHHSRAKVTLLYTKMAEPQGYGRVVLDSHSKKPVKIIEQADLPSTYVETFMVNTGIYCFDMVFLESHLSEIKNRNAKSESDVPL